MDKEYIPSRKVCYDCGKRSNPAASDWKPMMYVGFKDKPQRWAFCEACFVRWMGKATQSGGGCPRKQIFKAVNGRKDNGTLHVRPRS